jgi:hypothetical protein
MEFSDRNCEEEGPAMTKLIAIFIVGVALVIAAGQAIRSSEAGPVLAQAAEQ